MSFLSGNRYQTTNIDLVHPLLQKRTKMKEFAEIIMGINSNLYTYDYEKVFDYLNDPQQVGKLIHAAETGRPALEGCVQELESGMVRAKTGCLDVILVTEQSANQWAKLLQRFSENMVTSQVEINR